MATYLPAVTTIQPAQSNNGTGPIICFDKYKSQYFVNGLFIQPIVDIHTTNNQSVYRGVLRKEIKEDSLNNNKEYCYFVYTERHEDLNQATGVHVTFDENNPRNIPCKNIANIGRTTSQLELDTNNCETINTFLSSYGDAISRNTSVDVIYDSTSKTKQGRREKIRDPMKDDDVSVIMDNYVCLLKTIEVQYVKPFLIQENILDRKDKNRLKEASKVSMEEAKEELLDIVMHASGTNVFPIFVKCLYDAGYEDLASTLQPSVYFSQI